MRSRSIALGEFHNLAPAAGRLELNVSVAMIISAIIGSISFAGSLVAFAKLQELIGGRPIVYPGQKVVNALVIAVGARARGGHPHRARVAVAARRRDPRLRSRSASSSCSRSAAPTCPS